MVTDKPIVELADVSHRYDETLTVHEMNLAVRAGEHVALLGPNGSGKTTLLSLVAGILRPSLGTVERAGEVAFVVQRSAVPERLPITVRDTVAMGRWASRGIWRPLGRLDRTIIDECMERMDLRDLAGRRLGELSGGQRQRALLAQALAQRAPILLLDEPEAGLDLDARSRIAAVLAEEAARGAAVVVATHDTRTAAAAARCVLLRTGRVVADGAPGEVLTGSGVAEILLTSAAHH